MLDRVSELALRISTSDADQLKQIFLKELSAKGWSDEERETLMQAFDTRAAWLNKLAIGTQEPRWK